MKRVSFEVAKAIKEAGYPQELPPTPVWFYCLNGSLSHGALTMDNKYFAPTYLEVWLWLWKEKKIKIKPIEDFGTYIQGFEDEIQIGGYSDLEEAIEETIEYLVDNNLVK